jgi:hypothetical protein
VPILLAIAYNELYKGSNAVLLILRDDFIDSFHLKSYLFINFLVEFAGKIIKL